MTLPLAPDHAQGPGLQPRQQNLEAVAGPGPTPLIQGCRVPVTDARRAAARFPREGPTREAKRHKGSRAPLQTSRGRRRAILAMTRVWEA